MNGTTMLFPITRSELWKQIWTTIKEVVTEKLNLENLLKTSPLLPEKALLKASDVCELKQ